MTPTPQAFLDCLQSIDKMIKNGSCPESIDNCLYLIKACVEYTRNSIYIQPSAIEVGINCAYNAMLPQIIEEQQRGGLKSVVSFTTGPEYLAITQKIWDDACQRSIGLAQEQPESEGKIPKEYQGMNQADKE